MGTIAIWETVKGLSRRLVWLLPAWLLRRIYSPLRCRDGVVFRRKDDYAFVRVAHDVTRPHISGLDLEVFNLLPAPAVVTLSHATVTIDGNQATSEALNSKAEIPAHGKGLIGVPPPTLPERVASKLLASAATHVLWRAEIRVTVDCIQQVQSEAMITGWAEVYRG